MKPIEYRGYVFTLVKTDHPVECGEDGDEVEYETYISISYRGQEVQEVPSLDDAKIWANANPAKELTGD